MKWTKPGDGHRGARTRHLVMVEQGEETDAGPTQILEALLAPENANESLQIARALFQPALAMANEAGRRAGEASVRSDPDRLLAIAIREIDEVLGDGRSDHTIGRVRELATLMKTIRRALHEAGCAAELTPVQQIEGLAQRARRASGREEIAQSVLKPRGLADACRRAADRITSQLAADALVALAEELEAGRAG